MLANERYNFIVKRIQENGAAYTDELVDLLDVSSETIRRDLIKIEKDGLCVRVHGGGVRNNEFVQPSVFFNRMVKNENLKIELAKKAVKFVDENDIIGIDCGSTTAAFAKMLKESFENLTIITYSLSVFEIVRDKFKVILCGGLFDEKESAFYGNVAVTQMRELHTQKMFLAPSAISVKSGICDYNEDLILVQKAMYNNSDKIFILADSTKFEKSALYKIDDISSKVTIVTDDKLSGDIRGIYSDNKVVVY